jgi:hypothetical protein
MKQVLERVTNFITKEEYSPDNAKDLRRLLSEKIDPGAKTDRVAKKMVDNARSHLAALLYDTDNDCRDDAVRKVKLLIFRVLLTEPDDTSPNISRSNATTILPASERTWNLLSTPTPPPPPLPPPPPSIVLSCSLPSLLKSELSLSRGVHRHVDPALLVLAKQYVFMNSRDSSNKNDVRKYLHGAALRVLDAPRNFLFRSFHKFLGEQDIKGEIGREVFRCLCTRKAGYRDEVPQGFICPICRGIDLLLRTYRHVHHQGIVAYRKLAKKTGDLVHFTKVKSWGQDYLCTCTNLECVSGPNPFPWLRSHERSAQHKSSFGEFTAAPWDGQACSRLLKEFMLCSPPSFLCHIGACESCGWKKIAPCQTLMNAKEVLYLLQKKDSNGRDVVTPVVGKGSDYMELLKTKWVEWVTHDKVRLHQFEDWQWAVVRAGDLHLSSNIAFEVNFLMDYSPVQHNQGHDVSLSQQLVPAASQMLVIFQMMSIECWGSVNRVNTLVCGLTPDPNHDHFMTFTLLDAYLTKFFTRWHPKLSPVHTHTHTHTHIYIYI